MFVATLVGFALGPGLMSRLPDGGSAALEALVAGVLLHVVSVTALAVLAGWIHDH